MSGQGIQQHIAVVGAGLAGCLLACDLARAGHRVSLFERRGDPRAAGFVGGRSINLAISARGIAALREVGLADDVLKAAIPMPGRMIHDLTGGLHFQAYSKNPTDRINSVSRSQLNLILLNAAAAEPNVRLVFDHRCALIDFKPARPCITFEKPDGSQSYVEVDRIIGADGAFSIVRLQMMLNMDRFDYSQDYLNHGYKELHIPPAKDCGVDPNKHDGFAIQPNALHIWPRGGSMMIALPNPDRSFTCTCFWPFSGEHGFDRVQTDVQIREHFEKHYPDAVRLMPTLVEDFKHNPTSALVTVRCSPWHLQDKAVLIGDAAHAIVPFYGQGANAAFEDCPALVQSIKQSNGDWRRAFAEFSAMRKPHADAIADMALHNFIEMRDKTASPAFRARKKLEHGLHALLPGWFHPLYNMISFSSIPYADARARARYQSNVITIIGAMAIVMVLILIIAIILAVT
jgi:kynurenine 3-monooxygenase